MIYNQVKLKGQPLSRAVRQQTRQWGISGGGCIWSRFQPDRWLVGGAGNLVDIDEKVTYCASQEARGQTYSCSVRL